MEAQGTRWDPRQRLTGAKKGATVTARHSQVKVQRAGTPAYSNVRWVWAAARHPARLETAGQALWILPGPWRVAGLRRPGCLEDGRVTLFRAVPGEGPDS
jgi:hypothetical protein